MQDAMAGEMVVQGRSNPSRIVQLDALRGLAAMAVVLFHFTTKFRELYAPSAELPFEVSWGHYGVNLFLRKDFWIELFICEAGALFESAAGEQFKFSSVAFLAYPAIDIFI